jgi:hypothetical protein
MHTSSIPLAFTTRANAGAVPAQESLGLDDQQRLAPSAHLPGQQHLEQPVPAGKGGALGAAAQHDELLAQQGVLGHQLPLAAEQIAKHADRLRLGRGTGRGEEAGVERPEQAAHEAKEPDGECDGHGGFLQWQVQMRERSSLSQGACCLPACRRWQN